MSYVVLSFEYEKLADGDHIHPIKIEGVFNDLSKAKQHAESIINIDTIELQEWDDGLLTNRWHLDILNKEFYWSPTIPGE